MIKFPPLNLFLFASIFFFKLSKKKDLLLKINLCFTKLWYLTINIWRFFKSKIEAHFQLKVCNHTYWLSFAIFILTGQDMKTLLFCYNNKPIILWFWLCNLWSGLFGSSVLIRVVLKLFEILDMSVLNHDLAVAVLWWKL